MGNCPRRNDDQQPGVRVKYQLTDDYTAMYINNQVQSNEVSDCVFYYKAPLTPPFRFGCEESWMFHQERMNPDYVNPLIV